MPRTKQILDIESFPLILLNCSRSLKSMKMKHLLQTSVFILLINFVGAQAIYESIYSSKLEEEREIKLQLPRNYNVDDKVAYPLVIVLDGDYLFEPVAGNIDFQSYWDDMPGCIIVGINQAETRDTDLEFSDDMNLPTRDSSKFFEFVGMELLPYLEGKFDLTPFRVIVGHDLSANFLSYYLLKEVPLFRAYIALSPEFAPETSRRISERLPEMTEETFYYLATSDADIKVLREDILEADGLLKNVSNEKIHYKFDDFQDANHYSLVGRAIPKALNEIFAMFKPINGKEYKEKVLTFSGTPFEYLTKKYDDIEYFYGFKKPVIENDLRAIAAACEKKNDEESLEKLAKLAQKTYPDSMIGAYYLGLYYETAGRPKKALQRYQSGLLLTPSQFIDKDVLLDKIYKIKDEFGN
jgi:hypothetical protein